MMLSIQNFDSKITYKKGSNVIIADALPRAPLEDNKFQFHFSDVNLLGDKNLEKFIKLIKQGFRMRYKALEPQLKHLYKFRDYLSTKDDLVFFTKTESLYLLQ